MTYYVYEYDAVNEQVYPIRLPPVYPDDHEHPYRTRDYNKALETAKLLALQWCEDEQPTVTKHPNGHTEVRGASDFGALIIPLHDVDTGLRGITNNVDLMDDLLKKTKD